MVTYAIPVLLYIYLNDSVNNTLVSTIDFYSDTSILAIANSLPFISIIVLF